MKGGILTREQILIASERVQKIDQELAAFAKNNDFVVTKFRVKTLHLTYSPARASDTL